MRTLICTLCFFGFFTSATTLQAQQFSANELKVLISAANAEAMNVKAARCGSRVKETLLEENGGDTWYIVEVTDQLFKTAKDCWLDLPNVKKVAPLK